MPIRVFRGVNTHPNRVNRAYVADFKTKENTMEDQDVRRWALEKAIEHSPGGLTWATLINTAETFTAFIIDGTKPDQPKAEDK